MRIVIQWHWNSLFFQKITKNRPAARGFAPRPPLSHAAQPPSVTRLNNINFAHTPSQFRHFHYWFEPSPFSKILGNCQTRPRFQIFLSTTFCPQTIALFKNCHFSPPVPWFTTSLALCLFEEFHWFRAPMITDWLIQVSFQDVPPLKNELGVLFHGTHVVKHEGEPLRMPLLEQVFKEFPNSLITLELKGGFELIKMVI